MKILTLELRINLKINLGKTYDKLMIKLGFFLNDKVRIFPKIFCKSDPRTRKQ